MTQEPDLIILMGLQASGKTSFFQNYFAATHEHVSKDLFPNNRHPQRRQALLIENALQAKLGVVVDNTNSTAEIRQPLIQLGKLYGAKISGYYFESEVRSCIKRNKQRIGKARVPDVAIYVTASKLQAPTYAEGFDALYYVRMTDNGAFEVKDWVDETGAIPPQSQLSMHPPAEQPGGKPVPRPETQSDV